MFVVVVVRWFFDVNLSFITYYYHDYLQPPYFAYIISSFPQITLNMHDNTKIDNNQRL